MLFKDSKSLKKEKTMCICRGLEIKWNINKPTYTQNIIVPYNKTATVYLYTYTAKLIFLPENKFFMLILEILKKYIRKHE